MADMVRIYDSLSPQQQKEAWEIFTTKVKPHVATDEEKKRLLVDETQSKINGGVPDSVSLAACDPGAAPYCWYQPIENKLVPSRTTARPISYVLTQFTCDRTDPDLDYVFYFSMNTTNPDGLRWTSGSNQVTFAILGSGVPNGYGYNNNELRFCLGDGTVSWAGGAENVKNNLIAFST